MTAIKDLFASERGFFALLLVIACTVLAGLGRMTIDQWQEFSLYVFGIYVSGKTITGAVGLFKGAPLAPPTPGTTVTSASIATETTTTTPA